jgi:hypothetical protein
LASAAPVVGYRWMPTTTRNAGRSDCMAAPHIRTTGGYKTMNIERLKELQKLLATVPPERFNLKTWGYLGPKNDGSTADQVIRKLREIALPDDENFEWDGALDEPILKQISCGFAGCAMGWAALHPPFQEAGLHLHLFIRDGYQFSHITYEDYEEYEAAAYFFDIPKKEAEYLFDPSKYGITKPTQAMVSDRITELLESEL